MSRLGNRPVAVPTTVSVAVENGQLVVKGVLGELRQMLSSAVRLNIAPGSVKVERLGDSKQARTEHGLYRQLLANMIVGVSTGCQRGLEIVGVGYRAEMKGKNLTLSLGYSTQIEYLLPEGVTCKLESPTKLMIAGIDKQRVGQVACEIRGLRPPEPYKGKGVRYAGERVRAKAGKSGA